MRYFVLLLLCYGVSRLPSLLVPFDDPFADFSRGELAHIFLQGPKLPLWDYIVDPYGLGSLLTGLWTVPFFKFFGETLFAFRIAPFCWHLFSIAAWYFVWCSFYPVRKAFFISLFFVFAPPFVVQYSLSNIGYHVEAILWIALTILLFQAILTGKIGCGAGGFLLGILCGFSCAIVLSNVVTLLAVLFTAALYRGGLFRKGMFYGFFFAGFSVGFLPWVWMNWHLDWGGIDFLKRFLLPLPSAREFPAAVYHFFRWVFPPLFGFGPWVWAAKILAVVYLVALAFLGWRKIGQGIFIRKPGLDIETFGLFFQALLMVFVISLPYIREHHYLYPLVPFVGMTVVFKWRRVVLGSWILLCLAGNFLLPPWQEWGKTLSKELSSYSNFQPDWREERLIRHDK